jgi:hypothetical protein
LRRERGRFLQDYPTITLPPDRLDLSYVCLAPNLPLRSKLTLLYLSVSLSCASLAFERARHRWLCANAHRHCRLSLFFLLRRPADTVFDIMALKRINKVRLPFHVFVSL